MTQDFSMGCCKCGDCGTKFSVGPDATALERHYCRKCRAREKTTGPAGEAGLPDSNPKSRVGAAKPSLSAIPAAALLHLGAAMDDGKKKYGLFNWREHNVACSVYDDAIWRHLLAWRDGEDTARDSGRHHLAHVMACCAILLDAMETGSMIDDRGPAGAAASLIDDWVKKSLDDS